ncbi:MAG: sigma factor-like helix-turn-helix DNA-binding protein, partial [Chthoniobacteraceae bacterium]
MMPITDASPSSDNTLSMAHLQLGKRSYNACTDAGNRTIAQVIEGLHNGRITVAAFGKKTAEEIESAVLTLSDVSDADGSVDWERFWETRPIVDYQIALTTEALMRVVPEVRACGLGILHLKKACTGLEAVGIATVGGLLDAARTGIGKLKNFGAAAHAEVVAALSALSKAVLTDGVVDWNRYANERGFPLIPEAEMENVSGEQVLQLLAAICKSIIPQQIDDRGWEIFQNRLLAPEAQRTTLEAIGALYGVTRERIRQIEEMCVAAIRRPLFEESYYGLNFRLRPELRQIFNDAPKFLRRVVFLI